MNQPARDRNQTPWDIYIDERKQQNDRALGFLAVPNTASFLRKLHLCRNIDGQFRPHEVHWSNIRGDVRAIAQRWIYYVHQHHGAKFFLQPWSSNSTKEYEIVRFINRFTNIKRLTPRFNVVAFLDFDDEHSRVDIQNAIQRTAGIARCYHLDSRNNDCLQCCDLMMNATLRMRRDPLARSNYAVLKAKVMAKQPLTCSETKTYLAGHLAKYFDTDGTFVYDLGDLSRRKADTSQQITPPKA